jgi:glycosyltransferase involved in cell wall biosynthesis
VDRLRSHGVAKERIHLIRNAWARPSGLLSRDQARRDLGLPEHAWIAGWVGRVSREKGADVLLDALSEPEAPSVEACIIGDGPERTSLEEEARQSEMGRRVHWAGMCEEAARLYRAFDAFVLSSRTEGTPIALFEAMAAEVPIVATRVGGVPDVVGENEAWLVAPEDPNAIARALAAIRADPTEARRRCEAARQRLAKDFSLEPWIARRGPLSLGSGPLADEASGHTATEQELGRFPVPAALTRPRGSTPLLDETRRDPTHHVRLRG